MSAMSGLQGRVPGFGTDALVITSIIILVGLFSIQKFGTSKVGFMFAPALALWFFSLGSIGIYNLLKYDITVLRAVNPAYIYLFFKKNGTKGWSALGGCVLCITGAEAMFADLGHFSVSSIQIAFTAVVFLCLLLAYMGQAAYLIKHPQSAQRIFYESIPEYQVNTADSLLKLVSELKQTAVFSGFASLNDHVDQRTEEFNKLTENTNSILSRIGEESSTASLKELESHYYSSTLRTSVPPET